MNDGGKIVDTQDRAFWLSVNERIDEEMPEIDTRLVERDVPVCMRVNNAVTDFLWARGFGIDEILDLVTQPEFARLRALIEGWYADNYGNFREKEDVLPSIIKIRGGIFSFNVPKCHIKPTEEPWTIWASFPGCVFDEEKPIEWIDSTAPLEKLSSDELHNVAVEAKRIGSFVRSIGHRLRHGLAPNTQAYAFSEKALGELWNSSSLILSHDTAARALAGWALNQAVEKTYKAYLKTKGLRIPTKNHDLQIVANEVEALGEIEIDSKLLALVPSAKSASGLRYENSIAQEQVLAAYSAALELIDDVARVLYRGKKLDISEARFKIRAPWFLGDEHEFTASIRDQSC